MRSTSSRQLLDGSVAGLYLVNLPVTSQRAARDDGVFARQNLDDVNRTAHMIG